MEEFENLKKKIKFENIGKEFDEIIEKIESIKEGKDSIINLRKNLNEKSLKVQNFHKEIYSEMNKISKKIDKSYNNNIMEGYQHDWDINEETIKELLGEFFFRNNFIKTGQIYEESEKLTIEKNDFLNLTEILNSIKSKELNLLLKWTLENGNELENQIYELNFINLLKKGETKECINYAKNNLIKHKDFKSFMGSIIYCKNLEKSPYSFLLKEEDLKWNNLQQDFTKLYYKKIGKPSNCQLSSCLKCGVLSFPTILKYVSKDFEMNNLAQIPIEIDLGKEFIYQSIFTCPVSKEITTKDNPPMALSCGHVISKNSIEKLVRGNRSLFKCPYCPTENTKSKCIEIKNIN